MQGVFVLSCFGNIIWLLFGGIIMAFLWFLAGLLLCLSIIGIPFGLQCFKIAGFVLWPFGRKIQIGNFGVGGFIMNILWIVLFGWELAIFHLIAGIVLCITIIGIPLSVQHFKLAQLSLMPFGAKIY